FIQRRPGIGQSLLLLRTAELCASQIEMRAAAEAAESRAAFLAKAGEALAASLDYETTLETVAELAVPDFADWCGVDLLLKNGEIKRLAVKHFNPAKIAFMRELIEKYPPGEADAGRIAISTGNSLLMSEITEGLITARARDAEHARLILELGLKSFIVVPLVAPGRVFGALTFATAESQRTYTAADLQLAEDLARRAATAIDNAQLHREVRDNEERLRLAIDAGKIGAWDWDVRNDHVEWSDRVYEMHGVAPGTFGGKVQDFSKLIHPDDLQMVESAIRNSLERGEPYDLEFRVIHHTGEVRWLTTSARVIYDEQGRPVRMLGATMDTTDRRRAEEVAEKQAEALARSNSELQQFAFAASHDLQEPLRMVRIFGQLLSRQYKGKLDSQADQFLEQIESGTERMANLIQDLLAYSQVLHGEPAVTLVDCNEVLAVVLQSCRASIEESGALIEAGPLPTIPAEKLQLVQLFQNLLSNAIKYRKLNEAPRIRIDARETPKEWLLCFADNGIGIAAEHQDRIFAVFARLGGNESGGTGLGLAICERIVKRREGRIWVESEPGVGSRFYVALPRSVSAPV
ncbi:MAG: PAS domain-containing protein, partial [Bryobacteraceae bacterium]